MSRWTWCSFAAQRWTLARWRTAKYRSERSDRPALPEVAETLLVRHSRAMPAFASPSSPIPSAPFDDLDLDRPEDEEEWERRVMALATARIAAERAHLERLGIIDANGNLVSTELPSDMLPESDTTLETG